MLQQVEGAWNSVATQTQGPRQLPKSGGGGGGGGGLIAQLHAAEGSA